MDQFKTDFLKLDAVKIELAVKQTIYNKDQSNQTYKGLGTEIEAAVKMT